jgi:hypothetical protein
MDEKTTAAALAKQLLYDCGDNGNITIPKGTLKIVCEALLERWEKYRIDLRIELEKAKK